MKDDGVIWCHVKDARTDRKHGARSFMAKQVRKELIFAFHTVNLTQL